MFENSQDFLYLVISFCVLSVTVFLCWTFYYLMRILKNANTIVEEFRLRLQSLTDAINYIRSKVEHMSGLMTIASGGVGGLVKKVATKKIHDWMDEGSDRVNEAAKEAVSAAVEATAKKIRKTTSKIKSR